MGAHDAQHIQHSVEQSALGHDHDLGVVPAELANTVDETLPLFKRLDLLNPVRPQPSVGIDAYFGDYQSTSPDVYILPKDDLVLCEMGPGRAVFLSDGVTHHYAIIDHLDYGKRIVTLSDPWAPVSFMLAGHNAAGVAARAYQGADGQPFLDVGFDDFMAVLHGSIEALEPDAYFKTMETLYPSLAGTQDYLLWKYSRLLASGSFDEDFLTVLQIGERPDIGRLPKLKLLLAYSNDALIGVPSDFAVPEPGRAAKPGEAPVLRAAFLGRLKDYAGALPWTLKWRLLDRAKLSSDDALQQAIVDAFLQSDPQDVDFLVARAEILIRAGDADAAIAGLAAARAQWVNDVQHAIAVPPGKALDFFFARNYGIQTFAVMQWRYARITLLTVIARLQAGIHVDVDSEIGDLLDKYKQGALPVDFFGYVAEALWRAGEHGTVFQQIDAVVTAQTDDDVISHLAEGMFRQFEVIEPVSTLPESLAEKLRNSKLGGALCDIVGDGRLEPHADPQNSRDLAAFCGAANQDH